MSDYFNDISYTNASLEKYLKEKCSSDLTLQYSKNVFVNVSSIPKLFS